MSVSRLPSESLDRRQARHRLGPRRSARRHDGDRPDPVQRGDARSRRAHDRAADDRAGCGGCEGVDPRHADRHPRPSSRQQCGGYAKSQRLYRGPAQVGEPVCRRDAEIVQVRRESCAHREAQGEGGRLCEGRSADRGCSRRSDRRGRRRCRRRSADCEAERRSRPHRPRSHAADRRRTRAARQPDRRVRQAQRGRAGRPGRQGNGHGGMGIHGNRHRHDAVADRRPAYSPISRSPVRCAR